ncbi:hypothetical protein F5Y09DRAFT_357806 [Xylaria sp. FL1042]|nr:hypothetical protein F5Y09DRAFT_357806 [Xylaria sp. FL1042]
MVDRTSRRRSRSPRPNAHGSQHARRRTDEHEGSFATAQDEPRFERDSFDYQFPCMTNASWVADRAAVPSFDDLIPGTINFPDPSMQSELSTATTSYYEEQSSNAHYYSHPGFSYPAWESPATAYQQTPYDSFQDSMLSATSSPEDGASEHFLESAHSQTGPAPSDGDQPNQTQTSPTPHHYMVEADVPRNRKNRRLSMRARQGSGVQLSDVDPYDNSAVLNSTSQPERIEEQESSDSSGRNSPADQDQRIGRFVDDKNNPWSSERLHYTPVYQYPYSTD